MASIRLNTWMKDELLSRLAKAGFDDKDKAINADFLKFGNDIYNKVYPKKIQESMNAMPEGALPTDDDLRIRFEGIDNNWSRVSFGEHRRIFDKHRSNIALVLANNDPMSERYAVLCKRRNDHNEAREHARRSARAVLDSVSTVKKLCEVWPEIAPFCADFLPGEGKVNLPALPIQDLNKQFGLPPEKKGAKK